MLSILILQNTFIRNYSITKSDLKRIMEKRQAREFHSPSAHEFHSVPLLWEWITSPEHLDNNIFYDLFLSLWHKPLWEFQFIGSRNIPYHHEYFPFRVYSNHPLRWELCRANFK
ncbi:hypothetical protein PMAYCL1PPCAC_00882, partial [Pristionchus mayeri]